MDYDFTLQLEDNNLVLISSSSLSNFLNNKVYKLKLKKYVSSGKAEENKYAQYITGFSDFLKKKLVILNTKK